MSTATTLIETEKRSAERSRSKLVPELRFNEFEGQFKLKEFDEITDITRLAGYEYSKYWKEDEEQEIIALRGYNIGKGELNLRDLGYISNKLSLQLKRSRLSVGDIVYPCVGSIGNAVVIDENDKYHIQQNIAKITCNTSASPNYLVQFLTSNYGMREVYRFNASGAQPNVLVGSLRKYRINIPTLPEQQKIAFFLSAVDNKIQQLTKKKALLEQYKKGVMQQLFSGQLRFKDENGNPYSDWEEKRLGEVSEIITGKTPNTSDEKLWVGDIQFITPTDIQEATKYQIHTSRTVTKNEKMKILPINTIAYTCIASIGKMCLTTKPSITNQQINSIIPFNNLDNDYTYYFLLFLTPKIKSTQANTTLPIINKTDFSRFEIKIPCLEEQQKIATYLSSIDTKIERVNNQINQTQTFKKGLLQQMFV